MSLILTLKELWRRRALVALSVVIAAVVSVFAVYQVSFFPPSISERAHLSAKGSIEILVDSARSPIADARRDLTGLTARAGVFARVIAGGNVVGQIAKDSGIPVKQIDVAGPTPLPGEAPGVEGESQSYRPYGIAATQPEGLPILSVETRGPTVREARTLASAAPAAIRRVVRSVQAQQGTPPDKRVEFRALGPAQASAVDDSLGKKVALALFLAVLVMCALLILGVPRLVGAWRAVEADAPSQAPQNGPREAPGVMCLPFGQSSDSEVDDAAATSIGQREES